MQLEKDRLTGNNFLQVYVHWEKECVVGEIDRYGEGKKGRLQ